MKSIDILGIGNVLVDVLAHTTDKKLKDLKLPKGIMNLVSPDKQKKIINSLNNKKWQTELGGSSLNTIRILASLDVTTAFCGVIGDDEFGNLVEKRMNDLDILSYIETIKEDTGSCVVLITPDGERTMNTSLGACALLNENNITEKAIKSAKLMHCEGYLWSIKNQKLAIEKAIELCKDNETFISFDASDPMMVKNYKDDFEKVIMEDANLVFLNHDEAKMLFDDDVESIAKQISSSGVITVIKLGADGALIAKDEELRYIDPVSTTVVDTTAAGDVFAAGFLYGLTKGLDLFECGEIGAILAADVISHIGASVSPKIIKKLKEDI